MDEFAMIEDEVWLDVLRKLFEGKMDKARAILRELGFGNKQIDVLNYELDIDDFISQILDLILDELDAYDEALVYEKAQEML